MQREVGHLVPGLVARVAPDDRCTGQSQIANGVEDLVTHEFIRAAQTFRVQDAFAVHNDGILKRAAPTKASGVKLYLGSKSLLEAEDCQM